MSSGGISLTASMRSNLQSLQYTQELFDTVQERLATGNKVNSALDNPNNYFTAASLNNRASDLESLMDSMGQGVQTLKAADQGIETLTSLVEQAQSLTTTALDASIIDSKVEGTLKIEDYEDIKEVAGIDAGDTFVISSKEDGNVVESAMNRAVSADTLLSDLDTNLDTDLNAYQFEIVTTGGDNGDKSTTITLGVDPATATVGDVVDAINANTDVDVTASIDEDGKLLVTSNDNSIVTIRNADYAGMVTGDVDLSGTDDLDTLTDGDIASGSAVTIYVRAAEDSSVVTTAPGVSAGAEIESISGASTANGAAVNIYFLVDGVAVTASLVADSGAAGGSSLTMTNVASAINQVTGLTATITEVDGVATITITGEDGASVIVTGADTEGAKVVSALGLQDDLHTINISGGDTTDELISDLTITADGITASITENGNLSITLDDETLTQDLVIVGANAAAQTAVSALLGTQADATAGVNAANGTSEMATTFGFDSYNIEIEMPTAAQTADELVTAINTAATSQGLDITASIVDKKLVITDNLGQDLSIFDVNGGESAITLGIAQNNTDGSNARAEYAAEFDGLRTQINEIVQDTGYKGVNLLKGDDLTVTFNESRTSKLEIKGVTLDAVGLGIQATENGWKTNADIEAQLTQVENALETLRSQASTFGNNLAVVQTREDFTQGMIDTLTAGADKLTLADMNEEAANMLALQTRQQLGTNSLSLASQSAQSVLNLF